MTQLNLMAGQEMRMKELFRRVEQSHKQTQALLDQIDADDSL